MNFPCAKIGFRGGIWRCLCTQNTFWGNVSCRHYNLTRISDCRFGVLLKYHIGHTASIENESNIHGGNVFLYEIGLYYSKDITHWSAMLPTAIVLCLFLSFCYHTGKLTAMQNHGFNFNRTCFFKLVAFLIVGILGHLEGHLVILQSRHKRHPYNSSNTFARGVWKKTFQVFLFGFATNSAPPVHWKIAHFNAFSPSKKNVSFIPMDFGDVFWHWNSYPTNCWTIWLQICRFFGFNRYTLKSWRS